MGAERSIPIKITGNTYFKTDVALADDLATGTFPRLLPDYKAAGFAINAIYPNRTHLPTKTRIFVDLVAERFARHRKWMA